MADMPVSLFCLLTSSAPPPGQEKEEGHNSGEKSKKRERGRRDRTETRTRERGGNEGGERTTPEDALEDWLQDVVSGRKQRDGVSLLSLQSPNQHQEKKERERLQREEEKEREEETLQKGLPLEPGRGRKEEREGRRSGDGGGDPLLVPGEEKRERKGEKIFKRFSSLSSSPVTALSFSQPSSSPASSPFLPAETASISSSLSFPGFSAGRGEKIAGERDERKERRDKEEDRRERQVEETGTPEDAMMEDEGKAEKERETEKERRRRREKKRQEENGRELRPGRSTRYLSLLEEKIRQSEERHKSLRSRLQQLSLPRGPGDVSLSSAASLSLPLSLRRVRELRSHILFWSINLLNTGNLDIFLSLFHRTAVILHDELPPPSSSLSPKDVSLLSSSPSLESLPPSVWAFPDVLEENAVRGEQGNRRLWSEYCRRYEWFRFSDIQVRPLDLRGDRILVFSTLEARERGALSQEESEEDERQMAGSSTKEGERQGRGGEKEEKGKLIRLHFLDFYVFSTENRVTHCRTTLRTLPPPPSPSSSSLSSPSLPATVSAEEPSSWGLLLP